MLNGPVPPAACLISTCLLTAGKRRIENHYTKGSNNRPRLRPGFCFVSLHYRYQPWNNDLEHNKDMQRTELLYGLALYAVLILSLGIYWPGLSGPFLLDDEPNLRELARIGDAGDMHQLFRFVLGGIAHSLGRPVALLSFLINDTGWPTDPRSFKYTNILLHLLNGALLAWLTLLLMRVAGQRERLCQLTALVVTTIWLVHPLNVSGVLYVIQRMNELAALFTLAGLIAFTHGRMIVRHQPLSGYVWMSMGIGLGGVLATLSKENGILLVLYALIVEFTLFRASGYRRPPGWRYWASVFLWLPLVLLVGWHYINFESIQAGYQIRPFTLSERLLTESRVLVDYLGQIIVPRRQGTGLTHDDYVISHGLFDPFTTFPAVIGLAGLFIAAFWFRRRAPLFSFAVLWFIGGHALEAGIIPLEIYFEHRNYLPMIGPLMAATYYIVNTRKKARWASVVGLTAFIGLTAQVTWQSTQLWGNPLMLAEVWANEHPRSTRAQQLSANYWSQLGEYDKAEDQLRKMLVADPRNSAAKVEKVLLNCQRGADIKRLNFSEILDGLKYSTWDTATPVAIHDIMDLHVKGGCRGVTYTHILRMIDVLTANRSFQLNSKIMAHLYYIKGRIHALHKEREKAVHALRQAYILDPNVDLALTEAGILISAGQFDDALTAVAKASTADRYTPLNLKLRRAELQQWENHIIHLKHNFKHNAGN